MLLWPDGSVYEGSVKKGLPNGIGTKNWTADESKPNAYVTYRGAWVLGKMEGNGDLTMTQDEKYSG